MTRNLSFINKNLVISDYNHSAGKIQFISPSFLKRGLRRFYLTNNRALSLITKLATLEAFMGEDYLGTWCWGELDPNPHGPAARVLLQAFDQLETTIYSQLMAQTHLKSVVDSISIVWNSNTNQIEWDVSATKENLKIAA